MAAPVGLKVLFWVGLVVLAVGQESQQSNSTNQIQSTPAVTTSSPATTGTGTIGDCNFTVKPEKSGFEFRGHNDYNYTLEYTDEMGNRQNKTGRGSLSITSLKPCHNYTVRMLQPSCSRNESVRTNSLEENDVKLDINCHPGYLCYSTIFDLSQVKLDNPQLKSCGKNSKVFCSQLNDNDYCTDFKTTISLNGCFNINRSEYLSPESSSALHKIKLDYDNRLPLNIEWKNKICDDKLNISYTCKALGSNMAVNLSAVKPFQKYNCTGDVSYNHNHTIIKSASVNVTVNCSVEIELLKKTTTNESITLNWTSSSVNCRNLPNLTYSCSCQRKLKPDQAPLQIKNLIPQTQPNKHLFGCKIGGLEAYTDYNCSAMAMYKEETIKNINSFEIKTSPGKPGLLTSKENYLLSNNAIRITCAGPERQEWRGEKGVFKAQLYIGEKIVRNEVKNKSCQFEFKDLNYLTLYIIEVVAFNGFSRSDPLKFEKKTSYNEGAVIGFLVFLIVLTSLALLFVLYKIYVLRRKRSSSNDEAISLIEPEEKLLLVEPISAEFLLDTYKRKIADEGRLFLEEFQNIPRIFSKTPIKEAKKQCNLSKNRYVDILPYDYNRVELSTGSGVGADYINASFIDGYKESKKYIAAQGPKEETVGDFWRMIWEQQSSIIVMVTRCEEGNRVKCAQYWPDEHGEAEIFDEFVVKLNGEDHCPDYIIRHLGVTNRKEKTSEREVTLIQFTSWPDHGVPGEPHLLLKLRRRVNSFKNFFSGPIVIHCSAGVGRTGTYISIDAMMEALEADGKVDIYRYVVNLRRQRCLMVQVEAQYILIHQALIEHNQFGETEIPISDLHSNIITLKQKDSGTDPSLLEVEFQRLPKYKNWRTFNTGINEENKKRNRFSSVIPYDFNRVLVKLDDEVSHDSDHEKDEDSSDEEDEDSTKYINASHIDGYWSSRSLIATQGPLPDTVDDFWKMVHQKKVKAIVMLTNCTENNQDFCSAYWGEEKTSFGDIEVEVTATETFPSYITRSFQICHSKRKDKRQLRQYHFLKWAERELPEKPQDLTDMIRSIKQAGGHGKPDASGPVVVHCQDGSSRSGVFCALWNVLDCVETEKLVDIFQVAKALRKERQGMISSYEQYQFLYDSVEGMFPLQNGDMKTAAGSTLQVVDETKEVEPAAQKSPPSDSGAGEGQQGAAAAEVTDSAAVPDRDAGLQVEARSPDEKTPPENTTNGPSVNVES